VTGSEVISLVSFNYFNMANILIYVLFFRNIAQSASASPALPLFHASGINYYYFCSTCHYIPAITCPL